MQCSIALSKQHITDQNKILVSIEWVLWWLKWVIENLPFKSPVEELECKHRQNVQMEDGRDE